MTDGPKRIRLSRAKGWRMPVNTVKVDRSTKWGNPAGVVRSGMLHVGEDEHGRPDMRGPWLCYLNVADYRAGKLGGFLFATKPEAVAKAVELFRWRITESPLARDVELRAALGELRGKNLACWCDHRGPCHADVLLELANRPGGL